MTGLSGYEEPLGRPVRGMGHMATAAAVVRWVNGLGQK